MHNKSRASPPIHSRKECPSCLWDTRCWLFQFPQRLRELRKFSLSLGPRWVPYTLTCVTRGYANQFLRIEKLSPIVRSFRELFFPRAIIASRVEPLLPLHGHIRGVYTLSQYKYSPECYSRKFISILRDFGINIVHKLRSVFDIRHRFFLFFFFESIENQVGLILAEQGEEEERGEGRGGGRGKYTAHGV